MAEMSSMGIGNKPCLDIRPNADQINDRSISFAQLTRSKLLQLYFLSFFFAWTFLLSLSNCAHITRPLCFFTHACFYFRKFFHKSYNGKITKTI